MQTAEDRRAVEERLEARKLLAELARHIDRRLVIEVRDLPGEGRLQVALQHGRQKGSLELQKAAIGAATDDPVARNELRLKLKRAADQMLFRPMPDHRLSVKPLPAPGGQTTPRGRGGRR